MAAYATYEDLQIRLGITFSAADQARVNVLLEDAAVKIDNLKPDASTDAKKIVSCAMVGRLVQSSDADIPIGATQGSMSGLGFSQSYTFGSNTYGELYISKSDRQTLGVGDRIGSHSPLEDMTEGGDA